MNIGDSQIQMTLDLDTHLTERFRSAKEAMAAGVYRRGLKRCAADLDVAPGNLSVMLSGDGQRHLDVDLLERYVEQTGDRTPIYYLVAKHCGDISAAREELDRSLALKVRAPEGPAATGQCLSCEKPLPDGVRWCDADCRDDWQLDQRAGRVA